MMHRGALIAVFLAGLAGAGWLTQTWGPRPLTSLIAGNTAQDRITPVRSKSFQVELPAAVASGTSLGLVVSVVEFRPPKTGVASYTVKVRGGQPVREARAGGFGIFPNEAFTRTPQTARQFIFGLSAALTELGIVRGPLEIVISDERAGPSKALAEEDAGHLVVSAVVADTIKRDP
jgi:hypothetical protein